MELDQSSYLGSKISVHLMMEPRRSTLIHNRCSPVVEIQWGVFHISSIVLVSFTYIFFTFTVCLMLKKWHFVDKAFICTAKCINSIWVQTQSVISGLNSRPPLTWEPLRRIQHQHPLSASTQTDRFPRLIRTRFLPEYPYLCLSWWVAAILYSPTVNSSRKPTPQHLLCCEVHLLHLNPPCW